MLNPHAIVEQVALYLGAPRKFYRLGEPSEWQFRIIDGTGRGLVFSKQYRGKKFTISGMYLRGARYSHSGYCQSIGVSISRPPKDIAADINRRLLPDYLVAYDKMKTRILEDQEQIQRIHVIAQSLAKVTDGHIAPHSGSDQRQVYFTQGQAQIYSSGEVKLELRSISAEQAIKIAASVYVATKPDPETA